MCVSAVVTSENAVVGIMLSRAMDASCLKPGDHPLQFASELASDRHCDERDVA